MFVWNEEEHGVRPVEGRKGSFGGRETQLAACTCPAPKSVFVDNGENCYEQSMALHEEYFAGTEVNEVAQILGEIGTTLDDIYEAFTADGIVQAIQDQLPPGYIVQVVTLEEMLALGFTPEELGLVDYSPNGIGELKQGLAQEMTGDNSGFSDAPYTEWKPDENQ